MEKELRRECSDGLLRLASVALSVEGDICLVLFLALTDDLSLFFFLLPLSFGRSRKSRLDGVSSAFPARLYISRTAMTRAHTR